MTPLQEVALTFARLSLVAFGGGLGILPEMERQAVGLHGWVTHREFVDAFALSQVTPGPGMLMVLVIGLRAAGLPGALAAGLAMFVPTAALAALAGDRWARVADWPVMALLRDTLAPVALGLLAAGCYTLVRVAVDGGVTAAIAAAALAAMLGTRWSPVAVIGASAAVALVALR